MLQSKDTVLLNTKRKKERKNEFHIYSDYKRLTSHLKTQAESERMEKSIPCKMEIKKKARVGTQQTSKSTKTDFKTETLTRDKEGCYIKIKG